jgi:xylan 1,4-beta-xylosidase
VLVEDFRIDSSHSNAYTVWKAMGSPQKPAEEQVVELKRAGQLELMGSPKWVDVKDGSLVMAMEMEGESISLLRLGW